MLDSVNCGNDLPDRFGMVDDEGAQRTTMRTPNGFRDIKQSIAPERPWDFRHLACTAPALDALLRRWRRVPLR